MSSFIPLAPRPGLVSDVTPNSAEGSWVDGNNVRFRDGFPEKIGGWVKLSSATFLGTCRSLWTWITLTGKILTGVGTHLKFYVEDGGGYVDVTPIRSTVTLGANPLTTSNGTGLVTVAHNAHGAVQFDFITISGATAVGGLTTGNLNKEHQIITVIDGNSYQIDTGGTASSTATGGGAAVQVAYQVNTGIDAVVLGTGWGAGTWGRGTWGSASSTGVFAGQIRIWSQENWGEDLLISPRGGSLYYWDSSAGGRAALVTGSDVPAQLTKFLISPNERICFAMGCSPVGATPLDPLLVRWSDYEDYTDWTPTSTNAAGGVRLNVGSEIITGLRAQQEILVWTDQALFAFLFVGGSDIFQVRLIDQAIDIAGPNAMQVYSSVTYWIGRNNFYYYDGRVNVLPCTVKQHVLRDLNYDQRDKIFCGVNSLFNEIWWFYPSANSSENDRYVVFNTVEKVWFYGEFGRTAWIDRTFINYPRAAASGYLQYHEFGSDIDVTGSPQPLSAFVESAPFELSGDGMARGDRYYLIDQVIPDVDFRSSTSPSPSLNFSLKKRRFPGDAYASESTSVVQTSVGRWTQKASVRLRSRAFAFRVESSEVGVDWRLGSNRFRIRSDGQK